MPKEAEMKHKLVWIVVLTLALLVSACGSSSSNSDPVAVLEAYETAWNAKDIDATMALFAEDAWETNGLGTFTGRDAIRRVYEQVMPTFSQDCKNYKVDGNTVTYECFLQAYSGTNTSIEYYESVVENGLIKYNKLTGANRNP